MPNDHVRKYLEYYASLPESPKYAVMLTGPWGSGKTFVVNEFTLSQKKLNKQVLYVSLYGLQRPDDIDAALLEAAYPALGHPITKLAGKITRIGASFFGGELDISPTDVIQKLNPDLIIFDDLERTTVDVSEALGYINFLVEHDGQKAILIANEQEIQNKNEYNRIKEKLIGQTLSIKSDFDAAINDLIKNLDEDTAVFLTDKASLIKNLYESSGLENLRILRRAITDFSRIYEALSPTHRENTEAMLELLRFSIATSIEVRAGRLFEPDLYSRFYGIVGGSTERGGNKTNIASAEERYSIANFGSTMLQDDVCVDVFIRGKVDASDITKSLDQSPYFKASSDEEPWRTLWHRYEREDQELQTALKKLTVQLSQLEITDPGVLLHVFGVRLALAAEGLIIEEPNQVVTASKTYIDSLQSQGRLESSYASVEDIRFVSHDGLAFTSADTPEFSEIYYHLSKRQREVYLSNLASRAEHLLALMTSDTEEFSRSLLSPDSEFYFVPALSKIDTDQFTSSFIALHPRHQRQVVMTLKSRYQGRRLDHELELEKSWLRRVCNLLHPIQNGFVGARVKVWRGILLEILGTE